MENFSFGEVRSDDRPRSAVHAWLAPSYPDLALFIPIIVTAILIAGTMRAIMTMGYSTSAGTVVWTAALLQFVHLSVGLLITVVWRWSIYKGLVGGSHSHLLPFSGRGHSQYLGYLVAQ